MAKQVYLVVPKFKRKKLTVVDDKIYENKVDANIRCEELNLYHGDSYKVCEARLSICKQ